MKYKLLSIVAVCLFWCTTLPLTVTADALVKVSPFRISDLTGNRFSSRKDLKQPLVLSIFFTRCPPCIKEMPKLYQFMRQEGKLKQLFFVDAYVKALNITEAPDTKRKVEKFIKRLQIPKENVHFDSIGIFLRNLARLKIFPQAENYGTIVIYPTILVINEKSEVTLVIEGSSPDFLQRIQEVL